MEEELVLYVSEKDLEEFPESATHEEKIVKEEDNQNSTAVETKEEKEEPSKRKIHEPEKHLKIPSLLDLEIPEVYATRRNGRRWCRNKGTAQKKAA